MIVTCRDVEAQGTAVPGYPTTTSPMGDVSMGMGMGMLPLMYAMNPTASLSPTDAAALGMQGQGNAGLGANGMNSVFRNPMAAPYLFGNVYPISPSDMATMMLARQVGMTGIGSGQLSGVRPGAGPSRGRSAQQPTAKSRGSASQPGGLAARYFNRPTRASRYPQSYYTRQNRYYPQVTR
jgi:hypothetical protein